MAAMNQTVTVYGKLKERIEGGLYPPGMNLPEVELASELGVSRNTIKKALLMLEKDALVTIEQNKGAKVRSFSKREVLEYMQLRVVLEGFIVRLAAGRIGPEDLTELEEIFEQMGKARAAGDLLGYSALNQRFHAVIYAVCPNRTATETLVHLKNQMRKYNAKTILVPGRDAASYEEHRQILEALKARDAAEAEARIREHVESVRRIYDEYYSLLF